MQKREMHKSTTLLLFVFFIIIGSCAKNNEIIIEPKVKCDCLIKSNNSTEYIHSNQTIISARSNSRNSRTNIYYEGDKIVSRKYFKDDTLYSYYVFNYYETDSLPYERLLFWANGNIIGKRAYYYNEHGYLIRELAFDSKLVLVSSFEYLELDKKGNILLEQRRGVYLRYTYDDKPWLNFSNPLEFPSSQKNNRLTAEIRNTDVGGSNVPWSPFASSNFNYDICDMPTESFKINEEGEKVIKNQYNYVCY